MNAVLFGLLVVVCAFEVSNADILGSLRIQVQRSQNDVNSIINDMSRTSKNLQFSTQGQIFNKKSDYMTQINGITNPALSQIRSDVDSANAQGKDAEHCYTTGKDSLRTISLNGFSSLDRCDADAKNVLSQSLSGLAAQESAGERIKADLNGIIPSCYNSNIMQMANCITMKLSSANIAIRALQGSANSAKFQANSDANKAVLSISSCGMNVVSSVRSATTDTRITANNCVRNA